MSWLLFLAGLFVGAFIMCFFYLSARRENVRLDEEKQLLEQEQQIVLNFMHNLVEATGEGVDRLDLFQRIVHASILSTGALSACIYEQGEDHRLRGVAVEGLFPPQGVLPGGGSKAVTRANFIEQVLKSEVIEVGDGLIGTVAQTRKAILIQDARRDPRVVKHEDPALEIHSIMVTPINTRDEVLGVLAVANPADGMAFTDSDFSLVQSLAEQAAMAIHNSDLMALQIEKNKLDLDLSVASSVQGMLLPSSFPDISGLDIDAFYQPAQKVGGDLYDVFQVSEGRIGLAIADVSGKGIPASLLMAICQTNLRHYARQIDSPSGVLRAMNMEITNEMRSEMFITLTYAIIDISDNTVTLARAGHELPLVLRSKPGDKYEIENIKSEGIALGMVPSEIFDEVVEDVTVPFNPGDILVLFTDGVTETIDEDEIEYSSERLGEAVKEHHALTAKEINERILEALGEFTGTDYQVDDITLITTKRIRNIS